MDIYSGFMPHLSVVKDQERFHNQDRQEADSKKQRLASDWWQVCGSVRGVLTVVQSQIEEQI